MSGWEDCASAAELLAPLPSANGRKMMGLAKVSGAVTIDCAAVGVNLECAGSTGESEHATIARMAATAIRERMRMQNLRNEAIGTVCRAVTLRFGPGTVKRFLAAVWVVPKKRGNETHDAEAVMVDRRTQEEEGSN